MHYSPIDLVECLLQEIDSLLERLIGKHHVIQIQHVEHNKTSLQVSVCAHIRLDIVLFSLGQKHVLFIIESAHFTVQNAVFDAGKERAVYERRERAHAAGGVSAKVI